MNNINNENSKYLERNTARAAAIKWSEAADGIITLEIENKGIFNRIAQKLFSKPRISYIHLDIIGSFLWSRLNGKDNIIELGKCVEEQFGEEANPLYERLAKYLQILDSYHFISWIE